MGGTVCKFGGSSVADVHALKQVLSLLDGEENRRYVVVSAPGKRFFKDEKVTDLLFRAFTLFQKGDKKGYADCSDCIFERFESFSAVVGDGFLKREWDGIRSAIEKQNSLDFCLSRGEYLTAKILAKAAELPFADVEGLLWIGRNGTVLPKTYAAIFEGLKGKKRAVLPGFYGSGKKGVRIFPRGGGDITGGVVAKAVGAELYENWTDVSGFFACDPERVKNPKKIDELSYFELRLLFQSGASVLHGDAVLPLVGTGIPVVIGNTFEADGGKTYVRAKAEKRVGVAGITSQFLHRAARITAVDERISGKILTKKIEEALHGAGLTVLKQKSENGAGGCLVRAEDERIALRAVYRAFFT